MSKLIFQEFREHVYALGRNFKYEQYVLCSNYCIYLITVKMVLTLNNHFIYKPKKSTPEIITVYRRTGLKLFESIITRATSSVEKSTLYAFFRW